MTRTPTPRRRPPISAIRAAKDRAAKDRAAEACADVGGGSPEAHLDLSLGEPTWFAEPRGLPPMARRALASVRSALYGEHAGDLSLRRAIAHFEGVDADEVLVTSGAQGGLFAVFSAYLGPGDVALVPDPGFPSYRVLAQLTGAEARTYALDPDHRLDPSSIEEALDREPRIRLVVVNHPGNPTGGGASTEALRRVAAACDQRGVLLVSDEVYRELVLDPAAETIGLRRATRSGVAVGSIAKAWGAPGLRIGWLIGDPTILEVCRSWHAWAVTSTARPSQAAARALIEASVDLLPISRSALHDRWLALAEGWRIELGDEPPRPDGGFYSWIPVPAGMTSAAFCTELVHTDGVILVPGDAFGSAGEGWARLSFGGEPEVVREGGRRVARALVRAAERDLRGAVA